MQMKKPKKISMILVPFIIAMSPVMAKRVTTLQEVIKPDSILVKKDKLYVLERTTIFIYGLKNFRMIKKFGREGEGPREFKVRPFGPPMTLSFYQDYLAVNSNNKLSYFTLDGKYVKEEKAPPNAVFYRISGGYLGIGSALGKNNDQYICFRIFGPDFQDPKMLYESEISVGNILNFRLPMNALNYYPITGDKIYIVAGKRGFAIDCFNHSGTKLFTIEKKNIQPIKVTSTYKTETLEWFKNHPIFRRAGDQIKDSIIFKENYPLIKNILIDDGLIYVITNTRKGELWECMVMNQRGKEQKRVFVTLQDSEPYTYYPLLCAVEKGTFYSLIENEEDETWELHKEKIF